MISFFIEVMMTAHINMKNLWKFELINLIIKKNFEQSFVRFYLKK